MKEVPERSRAASYARAQLKCREVREDLVALQRDELSPLRMESVRHHLVSCPECREEGLELELAVRNYARIPELMPPPDLVDRAMRRVCEACGEALAREDEGPPRPAEADEAEHAVSACLSADQVDRAGVRHSGRQSVGAERRPGVLFRPVLNPLIRVAVAAVLLVAVVSLRNERLVDVVNRAQRRILGPKVSAAVERATDAFFSKLRL